MKAMKSKSFDLKESPADKGKLNKTFDFIGLYKSAAETNVKLLDKQKSGESTASKTKPCTPKREHSPNKKKKKNEPIDISHITIDGRNLSRLNQTAGRSSPVSDSRLTSTPYSTAKILKHEPKVKSIMKNASTNDVDTMDESDFDPSNFKRKKRNKSVSFMLDDTEGVAIKKTKSNESVKEDRKDKKAKHGKDEPKKKEKKFKKNQQAEKENKRNVNMDTDNVESTVKDKSKSKGENNISLNTDTVDSEDQNQVSQGKKKKFKKVKKQKKPEESSEPIETETNNNDEPSENKTKKLKKKKHQSKSVQALEMEPEGEPAIKSRKKHTKPDVIAEDLENLSIGDNAHTLTNLLDEMTVVDKDKKKKNKLIRKNKTNKDASVSSSEAVDLEKAEEVKEKIKWKNRKWNKDKKGNVEELETSVIVENLPLKIMTSYKKLLADHFGKLGLIKKIGIAEVYPTEESKPVFTTTINFYSEGAASKALEEDNTSLEGSRIRVKRLLPPTQTTLVVRSYAELTEQGLSSVFINAGRIRSIRQLVKGKKAMGTAFIEFDGPEAVERAIKMAADAKIGGKKIHVSKFEQRRGAKKKDDKPKGNADSENEGDSEDSND